MNKNAGPWAATTSIDTPTPGPWAIVRGGSTSPLQIKSLALPASAPAVFRLRAQKMHNLEVNAAHVVKCVNSHDALVRSLRALVNAACEPGPMGSSYEITRALPEAREILASLEPRP